MYAIGIALLIAEVLVLSLVLLSPLWIPLAWLRWKRRKRVRENKSR